MVQHFAGTHPEMVEKAILCDCTPQYNDEARANWPVRAAAARINGVSSLVPVLEKVFFTPASLAENGLNVRYVKETWKSCSGEGYALACEWLAKVDAREQAKTMKMPTLVVLGSNEGLAFQQAGEWMTANIPGCKGKVVVPEAGHASVRERPEFCIKTFRDFLS